MKFSQFKYGFMSNKDTKKFNYRSAGGGGGGGGCYSSNAAVEAGKYTKAKAKKKGK
tara:strand:+ start:3355 stop:3522 length:168 start_codon:yes stop_codon:yes gene_type:complete